MTVADAKQYLDKFKLEMPIFILLGQDELAPGAVRYWAHGAADRGVNSEKVSSALCAADQMEKYKPRKLPD